MYIFTLVSDVKKVVEVLRVRYGDFKLAMLYNAVLDVPTNWNLILASDWTDKLVAGKSMVWATSVLPTRNLKPIFTPCDCKSIESGRSKTVREYGLHV